MGTKRMVSFGLRPKWQRSLLRIARALHLVRGYGNCLALYSGSDRHCNLKGCFELIHQVFSTLEISPDLLGYGDGGQMISFDQGLKKLERSGWAGVETISIKGTKTFGGFLSGWLVSAVVSSRDGYLIFCFSDDLAQFDEHGFISLAQKLYTVFQFRYGIAYQHPLKKGADIYALGIVAGLDYSESDMAESQRIGKWFQANTFFREQGDSYSNHLRDVYRLNFLSQVHLDKIIDGIRLEDWISKFPSRGIIELIAPGQVVWKIRDSDIREVRETLRKNSLLVAYRPDVPPLG